MELSIVLPCHADGALVRRTLHVLMDYLPSVVEEWEVIVVDDGGNDFATHSIPEHPRVILLVHDRNLGKGAAVRTGMLAAHGDVRIFTDVDMPYDRELIPVIVEFIRERGFHLVVGDRTLEGSSYRPATGVRALLSQVASWFIGSLVTGGFHDTQCGIKGMRGDVADALFPMLRTRRFAFDVEVIYLALKYGLDVKRIPVRLRRNEGSSVRPIRDAMRAGLDVGHIKWHQLRGDYQSERLTELAIRDARALVTQFSPPPTDA